MKAIKTLSLAALAAALLVPASVLVAQPPDRSAGLGDERGFERGFTDRGFIREHLAEELELSEGQKAEIETLRESHREQMEPVVEQYRAARHAVGDLIRSEAFDEETVRTAARQAADIEVELMVLRLRHRSELRSVLTPEQQEKAAELRREWQKGDERFRGRPGRRGGHGPGSRPGRW